MRIVLCDDDALILEQLREYLQKFFKKLAVKCPRIDQYSSGSDLLSDSEPIDLLFLDIEMPGTNGIYIGRELKNRNKNIIIFIVTSYSEYLDDAMRFHVFRYLIKPLDVQRFSRNMQDALELYHTMAFPLAIETRDGVHTLPTSSIIAIEARERNVIVHTDAGDFLSVHNMQYWQEHLPDGCFFQTHRSFIINFEHVTDFDHSLIRLTDNRLCAYLTKRNYSAFKSAYLLYLESRR